MTLKISWLPNGHVVHGYRKVFVVHDDHGSLQGVVVFAPMGYEMVYQVQAAAATRPDYQGIEIDPALLFGLSLLAQQVTNETDLFRDDGYQKLRPMALPADQLLDGFTFQKALQRGLMELPWKE